VLGRLQAAYASVADLYNMAVREEHGQLRLHWRLIEDRRTWRDAREGAYLLRTNLMGQSAEELWTQYIQLTEAEAAFRALKSELSIRPLFHQLERRVKAHVLVTAKMIGGGASPAFGSCGASVWTLPSATRRRDGGKENGRGDPM
jgi:hypothetical protein